MKRILFNDKFGLTKAVLSGTKAMTRRVLPKRLRNLLELSMAPRLIIPLSAIPVGLSIDEFTKQFANHPNKPIIVRDDAEIVPPQYDDILKEVLKYSTYKVGEVVAVAQSYKDAGILYDERTDERLEGCAGWTNKMFVTGYNMPHQIRITNVRIERLQDISDEDCLREGIIRYTCNLYEYRGICYSFPWDRNKMGTYLTAREAFAALIDKVSGKGTWDSNPWVFVYEFERVK